MKYISHKGKEYTKYDKDNADHLVLLFQVGHGTLTYVQGNLLHAWSALVFLHHLTEEKPSHAQSYYRSYGH